MMEISKCGIISIIGRPNVGKSTIFNGIIGKKVSIVTKKTNTTRSKILGVKTEGICQMIFLDTPGIYSDKKNKLHSFIKRQIKQSLEISEIVIFVIEALKFTAEDEKMLSIIKKINFKTILIINKIDLLGKNLNLILPFINMLKLKHQYHDIIPFVAKKPSMIQSLSKIIKNMLPKSEFLFNKNIITNKKKIFFLKEILREQIFKIYQDEIPYSISLKIENIKITAQNIELCFILYLNSSYQKKIIIGKKGEKIKILIQRSNQSIEKFLKKKVKIKLKIKIKNEI